MEMLFSVNNQMIARSDNNIVVADSKNYLTAKFVFVSDDWAGLAKTAVFSRDNKVYNVVLDSDGECSVPHEVLSAGAFDVSVFGGDLITTKAVTIKVTASGYKSGVAASTPTPDVIAQLTQKVSDLETAVTALTLRVAALEPNE